MFREGFYHGFYHPEPAYLLIPGISSRGSQRKVGRFTKSSHFTPVMCGLGRFA
jgi:hypothetical protein